MRDGIWKGLPLPREWKSVLKSCVREAERGAMAEGKLAHALAKALADLSPGFLRRLQLRATDVSPGLPGLTDPASLGAVSVLEGMVAARFVQLEGAGLHGDSLARQSVEEALQQWRERMGRQIRQYCFREAGDDSAVVIGALRAAEDKMDIGALVAGRLAGERVPRTAPRRPVNLDEDLTRAP
jgi:hypothetical protein